MFEATIHGTIDGSMDVQEGGDALTFTVSVRPGRTMMRDDAPILVHCRAARPDAALVARAYRDGAAVVVDGQFWMTRVEGSDGEERWQFNLEAAEVLPSAAPAGGHEVKHQMFKARLLGKVRGAVKMGKIRGGDGELVDVANFRVWSWTPLMPGRRPLPVDCRLVGNGAALLAEKLGHDDRVFLVGDVGEDRFVDRSNVKRNACEVTVTSWEGIQTNVDTGHRADPDVVRR